GQHNPKTIQDSLLPSASFEQYQISMFMSCVVIFDSDGGVGEVSKSGQMLLLLLARALISRFVKQNDSVNYADLLIRIPEVLISVPTTIIRKFARKSWRYMDAYDKGLEGRTAEWAVSKFKSHRRLPESIERIMEHNN
ncbi:5310_t:CDS:2, partial [Ambispora gerdemannii]